MKITRFKSLLEAVPDALLGIDPKEVIWFVNRQTELLFGYERDELVGQPIETLLPEHLGRNGAEHREKYFADLRAGSTGIDLELTARHRDGTEFPVHMSVSPIDTGDVVLRVTAVVNVTEQRQAIKNAQLITAIVKYSDDAIIGNTLECIVTSWNPAAERMYGYSSAETIGRPTHLLLHPDRADQVHTLLTKIRAGQTVERFETMCVRKDGTGFPVSLTVSPIRDADGVIVGAAGVGRDATQQRQAFEAAQRMAAIVESSDDAIVSGSLDGIITSWNPAAERMYGYASDEIVGKPAEYLTPQDRTREIKTILARIEASQHVQHLATKRVRKDGTVFPVSLTVSPIRDADGTIVGTSVIHRDMTELEHAAQYARSLIEAGLDPLATISPEGKITDVNEAMVTVTGVSREALTGTDFDQYVTDPDKAHKGYELAFEQGSLTDYPLTLLHQDGTLTDVLFNASVYRDFNGTVLGVLVVARDASMLRHQQQLSVQLQEALNSRVVIEQAKGITAQQRAVTIDQAYQLIRTHARNNHASLRAVAEAIVEVGLQV